MNDLKHIDIIEVNVSCPNIGQQGTSFGTDPEAVYDLIHAIRQAVPQNQLLSN